MQEKNLQEKEGMNSSSRRRQTAVWAYANLPTSLMHQVSQVVETAQTHGVRKYGSKQNFVQVAVLEKLQKELGVKAWYDV